MTCPVAENADLTGKCSLPIADQAAWMTVALYCRRSDSPPLPALRKKGGSSDAGSSIEGRSLSSASVGGLSTTDDEQVKRALVN